MEKTTILVIGRDGDILQTVLRLITGQEGWEAIGARTDEEAIEKFQQHHFDIVLLTNGISAEEETKLRKLFLFQHPELMIIQHYGGGSGLLFNEITAALEKRKAESRPGISIVDDALKNAGLDIKIQ